MCRNPVFFCNYQFKIWSAGPIMERIAAVSEMSIRLHSADSRLCLCLAPGWCDSRHEWNCTGMCAACTGSKRLPRGGARQQSELQPSTASPAAEVRSSGSRANTSIRTVKSLTGVMCLCLCRPHFSLDVRTRSAEGLLFFAATRRGRSHLVLYMSKGRIRLSVGKQKEIFNREKYNDGKWHSVSGWHPFDQKVLTAIFTNLKHFFNCCLQVIFTFEKRKFRLVVDGIRAQDGQLTNDELKSMQEFISPVFLGSAPGSFHKELKVKKW